MSLTEFSQILDKIKPYTDYIYLHIKGEPLLHPNLKEILDLCYQHEVYANITTNGREISFVRDILTHSPALRQINISLHSFLDTDKNFERKELNTYLNEIIIVAKELSQNTNTITRLRLWNLNKESITKESMKRNSYILEKLKGEFKGLDLSPILESKLMKKGIQLEENIYLNFDYEFSWPSLEAPYIGDTGYCYGLKNQLGILVDGTVVPCCLDENGIVDLGNIFQDNLNNILNSTKARNIVRDFSCRKVKEELCKRCGYRERFS